MFGQLGGVSFFKKLAWNSYRVDHQAQRKVDGNNRNTHNGSSRAPFLCQAGEEVGDGGSGQDPLISA